MESGKWTWEKMTEYAKALTKDKDGDGQTDQWGLGGYINYFYSIPRLLDAYDTSLIKMNKYDMPDVNHDDPKVIEALNYIYNWFNVDKVVCRDNSYEKWQIQILKKKY